MNVYTFSEARQNLASVLDQANKEGGVYIKRRDGSSFLITPETSSDSPLDIQGIDLDLSKDEIIDFIKEGRRNYNK